MSFSCLIVAALGFALATQKEASLEVGRQLLAHRLVIHRIDRTQRQRGRPLLVWMGDSTLLAEAGVESYANRIARRIGPSIGRLQLVQPGLDFYHHYYLIGKVVELEPRLIVVALNLRLFDARVGQPRNDLASALPWTELPRAAGLPLHARGLTLPKLLLLQLLDVPLIEQGYTFSRGLQQRFHESSWWNPLGQVLPDRTRLSRIWHVLSRYDVDITPDAPMSQMLEATVRVASEHEVPILIVVSPIPWEMLKQKGLYDRERQRERIAVLHELVDRAGGVLIDAHALLLRSGFRDHVGHFTDEGAEQLSRAIEPRIRSLLRGAARPAHIPPARPSMRIAPGAGLVRDADHSR